MLRELPLEALPAVEAASALAVGATWLLIPAVEAASALAVAASGMPGSKVARVPTGAIPPIASCSRGE